MKKLNSIQFYGMPLPIYAFFAIIVLACAYFNIIPNQMIGAVAVLFAFGILIGEIGERLPIWNKFLGGGAMLCFLAAGLLKYFNLLPECVTNVSDGWINGYSFLNVFITFLVVGSLLGIDRDVLIKSGSLYIPTLLCSLLGACVFGVVAGLIFGNDPLYLITSYVLPIMGGGAGAGAVPMAQVYSDATGQDSAGYLSFCMAILALGNIVAILMAVVMDLIGRAFPKMTGHGELLRVKNKSLEVESKKPAPAVTVDDIAAAIFICAGFFMLGQLVSKKILPTVFGVAIPNFAYMIIFAALANIFNLIPENLREACRRCQHFCGNKLVWIQMVGMGISAINFSTMFSVASWQNVVIVLMIVIGCWLCSLRLDRWLLPCRERHHRWPVHGKHGRRRRPGRSGCRKADGPDGLRTDLLPHRRCHGPADRFHPLRIPLRYHKTSSQREIGFAGLSFLLSNLREWGRFLRESLCLSPDGYVIICS